ncbi:NAD(P)H-dependent glycerol-3-phosphate dehydrogenase [Peptostreptococcus faecalis]|uniref:NAD(P)H-dependent glycerol-3-phosphate dehydrogenase n=1 Tax=Peptostreptococcus faecalis TaxID=2045015 RepID=UPI000C7CCC64|nr:NAD(P)H-dependent glycerol-3-phosphate dehydrogenase [Peptostreptococcus faecalis]
MSKVCVLGAGSWGSALAMVLDDNGHDVMMWSRRNEQCEEINLNHTNNKYLPNIDLNKSIYATNNIEEAVRESEIIVLAIPSQQVRNISIELSKIVKKEQILVNVAKGIENGSGKRLSVVCKEELPENKYCMLSGPSHAEEVSKNVPTAVVASSEDINISQTVQDFFMNPSFRVYTNTDLIGVELGGATKNIIAFGAGVLDGLGYGDNSKAALMTRGLTEISRFGVAMGAELSTFSGLSGIGDLIVTCTSVHSRNRKAGLLIGQGYSLENMQKEVNMVVEGITATKAVHKMAQNLDIEMPITEYIYKVIEEGLEPEKAVVELMTRSKKHEMEPIFKL